MARNPINRASATSRKVQNKPRIVPGVWVLAVLAILVLAWGGRLWWQGRKVGTQFDSLIVQGKAALARVKVNPDARRNHTDPNLALSYASDPPTSGTHWPTWVNAGFYAQPQAKEKLVHALEHGNVVVYYDQPGQEALGQLRSWAEQFGGQWDGLVVVPKAGIGQTIELTAWNKLLRLEFWDAASAAAFIDAYRGRGPENPIR